MSTNELSGYIVLEDSTDSSNRVLGMYNNYQDIFKYSLIGKTIKVYPVNYFVGRCLNDPLDTSKCLFSGLITKEVLDDNITINFVDSLRKMLLGQIKQIIIGDSVYKYCKFCPGTLDIIDDKVLNSEYGVSYSTITFLKLFDFSLELEEDNLTVKTYRLTNLKYKIQGSFNIIEKEPYYIVLSQ